MPIYEYHCKACNKDFETIQRITDEPSANCPDCGKKAKRIISQTSFTLKGGGWYKDGYSDAPLSGAKTKDTKVETTKKEPEKKKTK